MAFGVLNFANCETQKYLQLSETVQPLFGFGQLSLSNHGKQPRKLLFVAGRFIVVMILSK